MGYVSLKALGRVPATCSAVGHQSISLRWWYIKHTQVMKYLLTEEVDIPNLHARSFSGRSSHSLINVRKKQLKESSFFDALQWNSWFPSSLDGLLMVQGIYKRLPVTQKMEIQYTVSPDYHHA